MHGSRGRHLPPPSPILPHPAVQSPFQVRSVTPLAFSATAPINPRAGAICNRLQSPPAAASPNKLTTSAGSPARKLTSTALSDSAIPSPVALSHASLRVHKL